MDSSQRRFITDDGRQKIVDFVEYLVKHMGRAMPDTLWHYTDFGGLEGILKTGEIYTTQHSCLNDSLEYLHLPRLILSAVEKRIPTENNRALASFFDQAIRYLKPIDITATGQFVACFTEDRDDLGQWRGYGAGVCGYAIGFAGKGISAAANRRADTLLLPMQYSEATHERLTLEIVTFASNFYLAGLGAAGEESERWGGEVLAELALLLDVVISLVKHPKFKFESERRIATKLQTDEQSRMIFRQKRTLLARHLPLSLANDDGRLPLLEVMVGPGPEQRATKIAVGDLLVRHRYPSNIVTCSEVPYRIP